MESGHHKPVMSIAFGPDSQWLVSASQDTTLKLWDLKTSPELRAFAGQGKDTKFRADVAERIGLGFELPKAETTEVVPSVPNSQETEVTVSI